MIKQKYKHPPITEAILDLRVELPAEVTPEALQAFHNDIKSEFPESEEIFRFEGGFQFSKGFASTGSQLSHQHIGYSFKPSDKTKVVQVRTDGFTFNKLKPYEGWESLQPQAQRLWTKYFNLVKPKRITRIALRYINQVAIPTNISNISEYVRTTPQVSGDIPQSMDGFFMRLSLIDKNSNSRAFLVETIGRQSDSGAMSFILDIDAFQTVDLNHDDLKIWDIFKQLRTFKNCIFDGSFTQRGKDLFS